MVPTKAIIGKRFGFFFGILFAGVLACNLQTSTPTASPSPPPTLTPTETFTPLPLDPSRTLAPPETLAAGLTITAAPENASTGQPTFTPIQPTLASTITPSATPVLRPTLRATRSPTPAQSAVPTSSGPLSFSYEITWRLSPNDPMEAIATVSIFASGGGGGYTYYRDTFEVEGSTFEYLWRVCKPNPGTLTVSSADGQSLDVKYFENPPCPTPTPSPTP